MQHHKYQTKCELIKCFGRFNFNYCGLNNNICSKNLMTECNEYNKILLNKYVKILIGLEPSLNIKIINNNEKDKIKNFYKHIQNCIRIQFKYMNKKIDCKCPANNSFKCDNKYCATDSIACDLFKLNKTLFVNINKCGNNDVSIFCLY